MSKVLRVTLCVSAIAIAYGACFLLETQPTRHTTWPRYLGFAVFGGLLMLAFEAVSERAGRDDRTTDALVHRVLRLGVLLTLAATAFVIFWLLTESM